MQNLDFRLHFRLPTFDSFRHGDRAYATDRGTGTGTGTGAITLDHTWYRYRYRDYQFMSDIIIRIHGIHGVFTCAYFRIVLHYPSMKIIIIIHQ